MDAFFSISLELYKFFCRTFRSPHPQQVHIPESARVYEGAGGGGSGCPLGFWSGGGGSEGVGAVKMVDFQRGGVEQGGGRKFNPGTLRVRGEKDSQPGTSWLAVWLVVWLAVWLCGSWHQLTGNASKMLVNACEMLVNISKVLVNTYKTVVECL